MSGRVIKCGKEVTFFAAANSGRGFVSFYPEVFEGNGITRRYLIKGGPGTGKSTLMRAVARRALDEGMCVEYYRCSSDPQSLDAVVIEGRVAVIDATSPHCVEPRLAGASDEIINLGAFWNDEGLAARRSEIETLSQSKSESYESAYAFLSAAYKVRKNTIRLFEKFINKGKMKKTALRISRTIPKQDKFSTAVGLRSAIGMSGEVSLDTYEQIADKIYWISDAYGSGALLLNMLIEEAKRRKNSISISYDPLEPSEPDALLFEESKIAFIIGEVGCEGKENKYINMKRFFEIPSDKASVLRRKYREFERIKARLMSLATESLAEAGESHFELEKIYKSCMDFKSLERFSSFFLERVIRNVRGVK